MATAATAATAATVAQGVSRSKAATMVAKRLNECMRGGGGGGGSGGGGCVRVRSGKLQDKGQQQQPKA